MPILKNNKICGLENINKLKSLKLKLELHSLALDLAQSMFGKCYDC